MRKSIVEGKIGNPPEFKRRLNSLTKILSNPPKLTSKAFNVLFAHAFEGRLVGGYAISKLSTRGGSLRNCYKKASLPLADLRIMLRIVMPFVKDLRFLTGQKT